MLCFKDYFILLSFIPLADSKTFEIRSASFIIAVVIIPANLAIIRLCKSVVVCTCVGSLCSILKEKFAVLLLILGVLVAIQGVKKLLEKPEEKKVAA